MIEPRRKRFRTRRYLTTGVRVVVDTVFVVEMTKHSLIAQYAVHRRRGAIVATGNVMQPVLGSGDVLGTRRTRRIEVNRTEMLFASERRNYCVAPIQRTLR